MTVIAWDGKTLAADTAVTSGNDYIAEFTKVFTLKSGSIIGIAGSPDEREVINLLNQTDENPSSEDLKNLGFDLDCVLVNRDKEVWHIAAGVDKDRPFAQMYKIDSKFTAAGSGGSLALLAMHMGATAEEACRWACKFNNSCREPIRTLKLKRLVTTSE